VYQNNHDVENELREGLRPRRAPHGFADRVIARAQTEPAQTETVRPRIVPSALSPAGPIMRWAIAAGLLLAVGLGGYSERRREEHIAGERARQQVFLALRITSATLHAVQDKLAEGDR